MTVFGNHALMLAFWKKTPSTYTFSESLIVIEYNHEFSKKLLSQWYEKKYPETLLRLNWFAPARELSERRD